MNTHIGDRIFQDTPHHVAKFRRSRPRDVKKPVVRKKEITGPKYNSLRLSL